VSSTAEWDEFKTLDFDKIYSTMVKPAFVFDGEQACCVQPCRGRAAAIAVAIPCVCACCCC